MFYLPEKFRASGILLGPFMALLPGCARSQQNLPDIILIVADDHGTDALGCYGNPVIKTPALDALASDGIRFTNAFCTSASSSPSRSVILTGMQNHANGMYGLQHEFHHFSSLDNIKSLPVRLTGKGYRTVRVGKFHVAPENVYRFDEALSEGKANDNASIGRSPVEMADLCRETIEKKDKPLFLYFAVDDPHRDLPFSTWPLPNSFGNKKEGYPMVNQVTYEPGQVIVPPFLPDIPQVREELAQYYQSVSRLDQGVARLISLLKSAGKYDNSLVIYISDNGMAFPGAKTTLYDPGIRLPCIIKLPGQKNGNRSSDAMISWVDLTPTILDFADGMPPDPKFHGRSFRPVLESSGRIEGWDKVFASHSLHEITMYYPMRMVRNTKYKLIWNLASGLEFPFAWDLYESASWKGILEGKLPVMGKRPVENFIKRPEFELYDIVNDPDEVVNLAYNPQYSTVLEGMKNEIKDFQKRTGDPWLYKWEYE